MKALLIHAVLALAFTAGACMPIADVQPRQHVEVHISEAQWESLDAELRQLPDVWVGSRFYDLRDGFRSYTFTIKFRRVWLVGTSGIDDHDVMRVSPVYEIPRGLPDDADIAEAYRVLAEVIATIDGASMSEPISSDAQ